MKKNTTIKLGMVEELNPKYRIWWFVFLFFYILFNLYFYYKMLSSDIYALLVSLLMLPSVLLVSLPSLFPEKEVFQLYIKFTDSQLLYRNNYFKKALSIDYSEIESIEIKPTKVIINRKEKTDKISFNMTGFKKTQEIKANFEQLKTELENV